MVDLEEEDVQSGAMTFADNGTEQGTLAEYLNENFLAGGDDATPAYSVEDVDAANDTAIQNLNEVAVGTVLD